MSASPGTPAAREAPAKAGVAGSLARSTAAIGKILAPLVPRARPRLIRQHELVERVKSYDPTADE